MKNAPVAWLLVVALVAAAAGYFSYQRLAAPRSGLTQLPASPAADVRAETPTAAIPEEVPDLKLEDLAGKRQALRAADGHTRLFNFWATWCEPCRREIPLLNALQSDYGAESLQVVGIAVDTRAAVQEFLKTTPMRYTMLVGEDDGLEAAQKFGMALALPFSVFADEKNRIIAVKLGELRREEAVAILANMRALRAGTTTLPAAREAINQALKALTIERSKQSPIK